MSRARALVLIVAVIIGFGVVGGRLFYIQIVKGREWAARCREQTRQRELVPARRGAIRDRNGYVLASSAPGERRVSAENAGRARALGQTYTSFGRIYPLGSLAGHTLGYVGRDGYGLGGAEYAFDQFLRGENGWTIMQRDGRNKRYARFDMPAKAPLDGCDVYLTLDLHMQKIVETVLRERTRELGAKGAMAMIIDPRTGDVLAMANEPAFNPNKPGDYSLRERANRCLSYNYEPGSTFKVFTAASVLQERLKQEDDTIDADGGVYEIYDQSITDYKPFGKLSFTEAVWYSSNVCFAKMASEIDNSRFYTYTKDFGMGAKSGVELPGEEAGIVHPVDEWSGRTRVTMAIGQEVSVTCLQMMMGFGALCNEGILLAPRVCRKVVDQDGQVVAQPETRKVRRVTSSDVARRLRAMLKGVVDNGTGKRAAVEGIAIGGKTGTSQKIDEETGAYSSEKEWSSFIGFAPVENPVLVCGIVIDEPANGEDGGLAAAPAFRKILTQIVSHPELSYAERILETDTHPSGSDSAALPAPRIRLPDMCDMLKEEALRLCKEKGLKADVIGEGERILYQSPAPGALLASARTVALYTQPRPIDVTKEHGSISTPDCVGKDVRDAINAVNLEGLTPFVYGAGTVDRQYPTVGALVKGGEVCTLFCSFDG